MYIDDFVKGDLTSPFDRLYILLRIQEMTYAY